MVNSIQKSRSKKYPRPDLSGLATLIRDGSTDGTVEIIQELVAQDERIRFINQEAIENLGVIKSFHTLLKYEKADLYCFSDQDDVCFLKKLPYKGSSSQASSGSAFAGLHGFKSG